MKLILFLLFILLGLSFSNDAPGMKVIAGRKIVEVESVIDSILYENIQIMPKKGDTSKKILEKKNTD